MKFIRHGSTLVPRVIASSLVSILILLLAGIANNSCSSSNSDESTGPMAGESGEPSGYTIILEADGNISGKESESIIGVVEARLELLGASEYKVEWLDSRRISIMLEGIDDIDQTSTLISKMGKLEFKKVDLELSRAARNGDLTPEQVDEGKQLIYELQRGEEWKIFFNDFGKLVKTPYVVESEPLMTGEMVKNAYVQYDQRGRPVVEMFLTSEGRNIFEKVTEQLANEGLATGTPQQLAIVLDGEIQSAPTVEEKITGGRAVIDFPGEVDIKEIENLVLVIKAGALPIRLSIISVTEGIQPFEVG